VVSFVKYLPKGHGDSVRLNFSTFAVYSLQRILHHHVHTIYLTLASSPLHHPACRLFSARLQCRGIQKILNVHSTRPRGITVHERVKKESTDSDDRGHRGFGGGTTEIRRSRLADQEENVGSL
jgi:hypothetical protein